MKRRSKLLAVLCSTAVVGTLGVLGVTSALAATAGPIKGLGGKCVDVVAASSANGTAVDLYDCNGTGAQTWTTGNSDNTITALGKCLEVVVGQHHQRRQGEVLLADHLAQLNQFAAAADTATGSPATMKWPGAMVLSAPRSPGVTPGQLGLVPESPG